MYDLIIAAAQFANSCHAGQKRKYTNRPYITHPGRVAARTTILSFATPAIVAAAWLHDVIEDCGVKLADIQMAFHPDVAAYVSQLTNTSKITHPKAKRAERKLIDRERLRTISPEAKCIKLIDRIDNLGEMDFMSQQNIDFALLYLEESRLLLEVLRDARDHFLVDELYGLLGHYTRITSLTCEIRRLEKEQS